MRSGRRHRVSDPQRADRDRRRRPLQPGHPPAGWRPPPSGGRHRTAVGQVIERKRAEEALLKSVEDIHAVLDNVADGVMMTDEGGFIEWFNRAAQRLFGYPTNEV